MTFRDSQPTFAGGEVSESVAKRFDVAKSKTALSRARNTLGLPQGGQYIRPGLLFGDEVPDSTKKAEVLPFVFAADQSYALEFTPLKMRVYYLGNLVTRPLLTITGISKAAQAVVTVPAHDYVVGWVVVFSGVQGMIEINGLRGKVVEVIDANTVKIDINTSGFSTFTGDTGGVGGASEGGTGGYPPMTPGVDPPPPILPDNPVPPVVVPPETGTGEIGPVGVP